MVNSNNPAMVASLSFPKNRYIIRIVVIVPSNLHEIAFRRERSLVSSIVRVVLSIVFKVLYYFCFCCSNVVRYLWYNLSENLVGRDWD